MPGMDCWPPDGALLDGVLGVCAQAMLQHKSAKTIPLRIEVSPRSHLILTLPQPGCFFKKSRGTYDYTGNRVAPVGPSVGGVGWFLVHLIP